MEIDELKQSRTNSSSLRTSSKIRFTMYPLLCFVYFSFRLYHLLSIIYYLLSNIYISISTYPLSLSIIYLSAYYHIY